MLTESQFVQCEKIAHQTMPALKAQLDGWMPTTSIRASICLFWPR